MKPIVQCFVKKRSSSRVFCWWIHKLLRLLGFFRSLFFDVALSFPCGYSAGRWINALSRGWVADCVWSALLELLFRAVFCFKHYPRLCPSWVPLVAMLEVSTAVLQGWECPQLLWVQVIAITWRDAPVRAVCPRPFTAVPACCSVCNVFQPAMNTEVKDQLLTDDDVYLTCATTWFQGGSIALKMWGFT